MRLPKRKRAISPPPTVPEPELCATSGKLLPSVSMTPPSNQRNPVAVAASRRSLLSPFYWQQRSPDPWDWPHQAVSSIFNSHYGPVDCLRLSCFTKDVFFSAVDRFVESAVQRGIQELTLKFEWNPVSYQLLSSLPHCKSLHQLSHGACQFPGPVPPSIFPNLRALRLSSVNTKQRFIPSFAVVLPISWDLTFISYL